jgi:hypothetical protein
MSASGTPWSELHQMKVKTTFPNGICMKMITWHNPEVFVMERKEGMPPVEISYGLEQISRQWHLKLKS